MSMFVTICGIPNNLYALKANYSLFIPELYLTKKSNTPNEFSMENRAWGWSKLLQLSVLIGFDTISFQFLKTVFAQYARAPKPC